MSAHVRRSTAINCLVEPDVTDGACSRPNKSTTQPVGAEILFRAHDLMYMRGTRDCDLFGRLVVLQSRCLGKRCKTLHEKRGI